MCDGIVGLRSAMGGYAAAFDPALISATDKAAAQAEEISRDIGSQYVITYRPTRPLASAKAGEYRQVEVASRRVGLYLRSRKGYVVPGQ